MADCESSNAHASVSPSKSPTVPSSSLSTHSPAFVTVTSHNNSNGNDNGNSYSNGNGTGGNKQAATAGLSDSVLSVLEFDREVTHLVQVLENSSAELRRKDSEYEALRSMYNALSTRYVELIDIIDSIDGIDSRHSSQSQSQSQSQSHVLLFSSSSSSSAAAATAVHVVNTTTGTGTTTGAGSPAAFAAGASKSPRQGNDVLGRMASQPGSSGASLHAKIRSRLMAIGRCFNETKTHADCLEAEHRVKDKEITGMTRQIEILQRENKMLVESNTRLMSEKSAQEMQMNADAEAIKHARHSIQGLQLENALAVEQIFFLRQQLLDALNANKDESNRLKELPSNVVHTLTDMESLAAVAAQRAASMPNASSASSAGLSLLSAASGAAVFVPNAFSSTSPSRNGGSPAVPKLRIPSQTAAPMNTVVRVISTRHVSPREPTANDRPQSARPSSPQRIADRVWRSMTKQSLHNKDIVKPLIDTIKASFRMRGIDLPIKELPVKENDRDCAYMLGSRKVHLNVLGDALVVRMGGGYQPFLSFLERTRFS
eukprot:ANDGO_06804.mRNA.1 hypothetical protein